MKKINDFSVGDDVVDLVLRLSNISIRKTSANQDYASLIAFDGFDHVDAKIWAFDDAKRDVLENGEIYFVSGKLREYQGNPQLNINDLRKVTLEDNIDKSLFYEYAKLNEEELKTKIFKYIDNIDNAILHEITKRMIKQYEDRYFTHPAAVTMHHNYHSGLAYHVYSMLRLSDAYLDFYPFLNKDLLYSGIILHDLGKVLELSGPKGTEYTLEGNLIGHITLCANEVYRLAYELGVASSDEVLALIHLILSHHGQLDYGSPKEPQIAEAVVLNLIDNADSRLGSIESEVEKTDEGDFTNPLPTFNRKSFYKPKIK